IFITFFIIKKTIGLRVSPEEELSGLDLPEHGLVSAYADFMPAITVTNPSAEALTEAASSAEAPAVPVEEAVPVTYKAPAAAPASDVKITKLEILLKQERFPALKEALTEIGITGMTVTNVLGCGIQKGKPEFYRGVVQEVTVLPRVKVEVVVCKVPVSTVIATAKKILYTGHIGDGKIFVYDVENAVKVRTGEEGYDALQDVEQY
ncbi:MAG: P-II family nitrogen regulator, partial [Eubacteriales bacterium]